MYGFYRINVWDAENAFLGADMGGMGSMLSVKEKGDVRVWRVDSPDGQTKTIEINMKDSNKY